MESYSTGVSNVGLCCPHVPQRGRPPVLRSEQGCHATKAKAVSHVALGPVCSVESYSIGVYNVGAVHHEGHEGHEGKAGMRIVPV